MRINQRNECNAGKIEIILSQCYHTVSYDHPSQSHLQETLNSNGEIDPIPFYSLGTERSTFNKSFLRKFVK